MLGFRWAYILKTYTHILPSTHTCVCTCRQSQHNMQKQKCLIHTHSYADTHDTPTHKHTCMCIYTNIHTVHMYKHSTTLNINMQTCLIQIYTHEYAGTYSNPCHNTQMCTYKQTPVYVLCTHELKFPGLTCWTAWYSWRLFANGSSPAPGTGILDLPL